MKRKSRLYWLGGITASLSIVLLLLLSLKLPFMPLVDEEFCGSCHIMEPQVTTYMASPHQGEAECADCHVPHQWVRGSVDKAWTGFKDFVGVVRNHDPFDIQASPHAKRVIQENCLRCHQDFMHAVGDTSEAGGKYCFDCHRNIVHAIKPGKTAQDLGYIDHGQGANGLSKIAFMAQREALKEEK